MDQNQLLEEIARLKKENNALKATKKITFKVSAKGAVSLYGVGRFPVTLYKEQWLTVIDSMGELKTFIEAHDNELKTK